MLNSKISARIGCTAFFARAESEERDLVEPLSQDRQVSTVLGRLSGTLSRMTELGILAFKLLTNPNGTLFCVLTPSIVIPST